MDNDDLHYFHIHKDEINLTQHFVLIKHIFHYLLHDITIYELLNVKTMLMYHIIRIGS